LAHERKELLVIHRGIAVFGGQKVILVGDDGEVDVYARIFEIRFVHVAEAVGRVVERVLVDRVVELRGVAVRDVDAVVVLLAK